MALTLSITLDDEQIETYLKIVNNGESDPITPDMLYQNPELQQDLADMIVGVWDGDLYDAYDELFEDQ